VSSLGFERIFERDAGEYHARMSTRFSERLDWKRFIAAAAIGGAFSAVCIGIWGLFTTSRELPDAVIWMGLAMGMAFAALAVSTDPVRRRSASGQK